MLRTLIIDDEDHMRDSLTKLLQIHCPQDEEGQGIGTKVMFGIPLVIG